MLPWVVFIVGIPSRGVCGLRLAPVSDMPSAMRRDADESLLRLGPGGHGLRVQDECDARRCTSLSERCTSLSERCTSLSERCTSLSERCTSLSRRWASLRRLVRQGGQGCPSNSDRCASLTDLLARKCRRITPTSWRCNLTGAEVQI